MDNAGLFLARDPLLFQQLIAQRSTERAGEVVASFGPIQATAREGSPRISQRVYFDPPARKELLDGTEGIASPEAR